MWRILLLVLALVPPCLSMGEAELSETYLVKGRTENPAVLLFYRDYVKTEYAKIFMQAKESGKYSEDEVFDMLLKVMLKKISFDNPKAYPVPGAVPVRFGVVPDDKWPGSGLWSLLSPDDGGGATACLVETNGQIGADFKALKPIPVKVVAAGAAGGVRVEEALDPAQMTEEDWKAIFYDDAVKRYRDPFVHTVWLTTWSNLSNRWDALLKEPNGRDDVLDQMRAIEKSGRYGPDQAGGEAWRNRIWNYYVGKADLAPTVQIFNTTGWKCNLNVTVPEGKGKIAGENPAQWLDHGSDTTVHVVPGSFSQKADVIAELTAQGECPECWRSAVTNKVGAYDAPRIIYVKMAAPPPAHLSVTVDGAQKDAAIDVFFRPADAPEDGGRDIRLFWNRDAWTCDVQVHAKGSVNVRAGKSEGTEVVPHEELHGGKTVKLKIKVNDTRKRLKENDAPVFPRGLARDCLAAVTIASDYAVFDGKAEEYSNERELAPLARAEGGKIPVKVPFSGQPGETRHLPSFVAEMLPEIIRKDSSFEFKQEGEGFHLVLKTKPKEGTWTRVPGNTFYAVTWDDIRAKLAKDLSEDSGKRAEIRSLIGEIRRIKPAWTNNIGKFLADTPALRPRVTFTNETGKAVLLVIDQTHVKLDAGKTHTRRVDEVSDKDIRVREVDFIDNEYVTNKIPLPAEIPAEMSDDKTVSLTPEHLKHRDKPRIYMDAPSNVKVKGVEIKYADSDQPANGQYATDCVEVEAHRIIDWLKFDCDGYAPVTNQLPVKMFRYGEGYTDLQGRLNKEIKKQDDARKWEIKRANKEREVEEKITANKFQEAEKIVEATRSDPSFSDEWRSQQRQRITAAKAGKEAAERKIATKDGEIRAKVNAKDFSGARTLVTEAKPDSIFDDEWRRGWNDEINRKIRKLREDEIREKIKDADFSAAKKLVKDTLDPAFDEQWRSDWTMKIDKAETEVPPLPSLEADETKNWVRIVGVRIKWLPQKKAKENLIQLFLPSSDEKTLNPKDIPGKTVRHIKSKRCTDENCPCKKLKGSTPKEKALHYLLGDDAPKDMDEFIKNYWKDVNDD